MSFLPLKFLTGRTKYLFKWRIFLTDDSTFQNPIDQNLSLLDLFGADAIAKHQTFDLVFQATKKQRKVIVSIEGPVTIEIKTDGFERIGDISKFYQELLKEEREYQMEEVKMVKVDKEKGMLTKYTPYLLCARDHKNAMIRSDKIINELIGPDDTQINLTAIKFADYYKNHNTVGLEFPYNYEEDEDDLYSPI